MKKTDSSNDYNEDVDIDIQACAPTDSTGLIPSLPQSEAERESYESISPYLADVKAPE